MTLFETTERPLVRSSRALEKAAERPKWSKYTAKKPQRCDECLEVAYESLPGPMPGIMDARHARRQNGQTRLLCGGHAQAQRDEDRINYPTRGQS